MMNQPAISAEGLGKEFFLGENTAQDRVRQALHSITPRKWAPKINSLWAIRDISFRINHGEAVGIIGHNGAGKSSLLKVLSRVTRPTEGQARTYGRVATLLEVGTGFHPELTGRDNIFLSGAILGMRRPEVTRKFDQIVAFSEVEKFLDTPVKRYSSGMYVRLAFAVAAFLDPEILIVDEVLAVGDSAFQRKSLGRLNEAASEQGRTVLFVSHNLQAIRNFCKRVLVLDKGRLVYDGPAQEGLERYLKAVSPLVNLKGVKMKDRLNRTSGAVRFTDVTCYNESNEATWNILDTGIARIQFQFEVVSDVPTIVFGIRLRVASTGEIISTVRKTVSSALLRAGRRGKIEFSLKNVPLRPNEFSIYAWMAPADGKMSYDVVDENVDLPYLKISSATADYADRDGLLTLPHEITMLELS